MRTWDRLSATFVRGLKRPGKFYDGGGLLLQATPTRAGGVTKAWLFRYQIDKRERVMGLGSARVISLAEARAKANEARKLLAAGIDPIARRDAERMAARAAELHTATFRQALDGLLASHGDKWRAKHLGQWRASMATYARPLFDLDVNDVDTTAVLKVLEPEWKRAPVTLDRVRNRIGEVLGFAEARGQRKPGPLPTRWKNHLDKLLPRPHALRPVVHHAALAYDEVPALYRKLVATDQTPELCLAFTILTAARSAEARGALWDEIDMTRAVWVVPPSRMKRSREHRVPLSVEVMKLIERMPHKGALVFTTRGDRPPTSLALRNALARHGGAGFTVHGFRSAFRDWAGERTHAPRELLEVALSHTLGDATEKAYARSDLIEKRRHIMDAWAAHCTAAPTDKVVPLVGERRHG
jgi:integrase